MGVILPEETVTFQMAIEVVVLSIFVVGFSGYYLIRGMWVYIVFKKEYVYTPMQLVAKKHRVQYATKILYKDIKSIGESPSGVVFDFIPFVMALAYLKACFY